MSEAELAAWQYAHQKELDAQADDDEIIEADIAEKLTITRKTS